jgi:hypothetical protein
MQTWISWIGGSSFRLALSLPDFITLGRAKSSFMLTLARAATAPRASAAITPSSPVRLASE